MLKKTLYLAIVMSLLVWAAGCSDNPTGIVGDTENLAEEFGGYTATAESPGFGDPELIASEGDEVEVDDPILTSGAVQEIVNNDATGMYRFRIVWGRIPYDSTVTEATDWSGSLSVGGGALVVRRLIRFEPEQDQLLPRTDRHLVEWTSATTVHNDGIAVDIYLPPQRPVVDTSYSVDSSGDSSMILDSLLPALPMFTFETGPYTRTFTFEELVSLNEVVELDDGNKVALHALVIPRNVCPRGIMAGHWGVDDEGNGVYRGRWYASNGRMAGYMRGHYEQNDAGENVFYGKLIDRTGRFEGFIKGVWGANDPNTDDSIRHRHGMGWFNGRIFDSERNVIGSAMGRYGSAPDVRGGWFGARWKLFCAEDAAMGDDGMNDHSRGGGMM